MSETKEKSVEEQAADAVDLQSVPVTQVTQPIVAVEDEPEGGPQRRGDIVVRDGLFQPATLTEATRIADGLIKAKCLPKQLDSVPKVLMAMQTLRQLGLPDIACLPRLALINGSFSLWGEGPKAICQPEIEDFEEFWFDANYTRISFENKNLTADVYGALCRVKRKNIPTWVERTFTVKDAQTAALWGKSGPWTQHPRRMLQMRTRAWALKDGFPDKLMGVGIAEYDHNVLVDAGEVPDTNQAPQLVERFK